MSREYINQGWVNLHNHSEFSLFDGFGRQTTRAKHVKMLGQSALAVTEHGSISGLIQHKIACEQNGIKPILGCEVYFRLEFDANDDESKKQKSYHMCLFCKNYVGYKNLMQLITDANRDNFYRHAIVTEALLKKYHEGLICSTACIGGYVAKPLMNNNTEIAVERLNQLKMIFGSDLYVEIMPYKVMGADNEDLQMKVDKALIEICNTEQVKGIITCDSHYVKKEDFETIKMVMEANGRSWGGADYSERYMPSEYDIYTRFKERYETDPIPYILNTRELADKCNVELNFKEEIPKIEFGIKDDNKTFLKKLVRNGLKEKNCYNTEYIEQCRKELDVIETLGFEDYFLLCWDIVKYALDNGIGYGPGRGSVCGSLVAYCLNLTKVDPFKMGTIFERFLRKDKKKMPDIDLDFESERRYEVIDYIYKRFAGRAAQVSAYGYYKTKNLVADLAKALGIDDEEKTTINNVLENKFPELAAGEMLDYEEALKNETLSNMEEKYAFVRHFCVLSGQVRYVGKHAGGVAIFAGDMCSQAAMIKAGDTYQCCYDLNCLEYINVLKMDVLGLSTVSIAKWLENKTGEVFSEKMLNDREVYRRFNAGETLGVFQFEGRGAINVIETMGVDNVRDIMVGTAINRPAPLSLGIHREYGLAKHGEADNEHTLSYKYLPLNYGCVVFQEDIITLGRELSDLEWTDIDMIMKGIKKVTGQSEAVKEKFSEIGQRFIDGAVKKNTELERRTDELQELFEKMTGGYLFNKGHAAGYALLSVEMMYFKVNYPLEFWTAVLLFTQKQEKLIVYEAGAARESNCVIIPAHVNGSDKYKIVIWGGDRCIQRGLSSIPNVGEKAALSIVLNAPYADKPDFEERANGSIVNTRVRQALYDNGALEYNEKKIIERIMSENKKLAKSTIKIENAYALKKKKLKEAKEKKNV